MNIFRKLLAKKVRDNSGYSSRDGSFPIEYEVGLYDADLDLDHLLEKAIEQGEVTREEIEDEAVMAHLEAEYHPERLWRWAQEEMCWGLNNNDGLRSYGPETAARYGLPAGRKKLAFRKDEQCYYPFKALEDGRQVVTTGYKEIFFEVEFGLYGRGGKHLVVECFEDVKLRGYSAERLAEAITEDGSSFANEWCQQLLAMMEEWERMFK